jgi:hypothetical protein
MRTTGLFALASCALAEKALQQEGAEMMTAAEMAVQNKPWSVGGCTQRQGYKTQDEIPIHRILEQGPVRLQCVRSRIYKFPI